MPRTSPHDDATASARESNRYTYLDLGVVTSVDVDGNGQPSVFVQETRVPADQAVPLAQSVHGDLYVPPEGTPVVVAYLDENEPVVVATALPNVDTPALSGGERIVSHPLSNARVAFNADGSLDVYGDTTVRINGGSTGIVTDVEIADTNSNGGATSLSVVRDDSILV